MPVPATTEATARTCLTARYLQPYLQISHATSLNMEPRATLSTLWEGTVQEL
jgi:hypothetical protein